MMLLHYLLLLLYYMHQAGIRIYIPLSQYDSIKIKPIAYLLLRFRLLCFCSIELFPIRGYPLITLA